MIEPVGPRNGFVAIARILGSWGARGGIKLEPLTDFPERFEPGAAIWLDGTQYQVEHSHQRRGAVIVELGGIDAPAVVAALRGKLLELPESELHPLGQDEYYQHDLIGLQVRTAAGEALGRVASLLPTGANDVIVVEGARGEYLLPLIEDVVQHVDLAAGEVVVELLAGLEPQAPRSEPARPRKPRLHPTRRHSK